jgi:hypothetical protein
MIYIANKQNEVVKGEKGEEVFPSQNTTLGS